MDECIVNLDQNCLYHLMGNLSHSPLLGGDISCSVCLISIESIRAVLCAQAICAASNRGEHATGIEHQHVGLCCQNDKQFVSHMQEVLWNTFPGVVIAIC